MSITEFESIDGKRRFGIFNRQLWGEHSYYQSLSSLDIEFHTAEAMDKYCIGSAKQVLKMLELKSKSKNTINTIIIQYDVPIEQLKAIVRLENQRWCIVRSENQRWWKLWSK
jgi:hypothetical protein